MAENALFWRIFVGATKKRENEACYMSITVVIVVYSIEGGASRVDLHTHPPGSHSKRQPYPNEKFFIFFYGKRGGGEHRKN